MNRHPAGRCPYCGDTWETGGCPCRMTDKVAHPAPAAIKGVLEAVLYMIEVGKPISKGGRIHKAVKALVAQLEQQ